MAQFYHNLKSINGHSGILVIGDVHGDFEQFSRAVDYALTRDLFLISLGDLCDYGPNSKEVIFLTSDLIRKNRMISVIGNHERKLKKWVEQKRDGHIRIKIKECIQATIDSFNSDPNVVNDFMYVEQSMFHIIRYKNTIFSHGAVHPSVILKPEFSPMAYQMSMFGEVDRDQPMREDGFPNRVFHWVEKIPQDIKVYVGHDIRSPIEPMVVGSVTFLDTGCSKIHNELGIEGHLSGAVLDDMGELVKFVRFD